MRHSVRALVIGLLIACASFAVVRGAAADPGLEPAEPGMEQACTAEFADVTPDCLQLTLKADLTVEDKVTTPGVAKDLKVAPVKEQNKVVGYKLTITAIDPVDYIVLAVAPGDPPVGLTVTQEPDERAIVVKGDVSKGFKVIFTPKPKK